MPNTPGGFDRRQIIDPGHDRPVQNGSQESEDGAVAVEEPDLDQRPLAEGNPLPPGIGTDISDAEQVALAFQRHDSGTSDLI